MSKNWGKSSPIRISLKPSQMATTAEHGLLVVSSNLTYVHHEIAFSKIKCEFPHVKTLKMLLDPQKLEPRVVARRPV